MDDNKLIKTNSNSLIKANNNLFSRALNDLDYLEFSEISGFITILGFISAYLPEYVPILSYLHKEFKDTNIKLFPINDRAKDLCTGVENMFLESILFGGYYYRQSDPLQTEIYSFELKNQKSNVVKQVCIRTFMGEFLEALADKKIIDGVWEEHLDELICYSCPILFLFNGLKDCEDSKISQSINYLKNYLSNYRNDLIRIPVIFHHFDHPELYPYKDDIDSFLKQKFPLTKKAFDEWGKESKITIRYFSCSLFGVVNNNGKIESNGIYNNNKYGGVLNSREHWKPFGVLSPIYWLLTGKYDPNFLEI